MKRRTVLLLLITVLVSVVLTGCGESGANEPGGQGASSVDTGEGQLPEVTPLQARAAMSDAMLASAISLFLAFEAAPGTTSMSNSDGSLMLEWDDTADFATGVGSYTIRMNAFTVSPEEVYSDEYNGYVLSGSVEMASTDGVTTRIIMDLDATHDDAETHPVQQISMELEGVENDESVVPTGSIFVNGHDTPFRDLADSFALGQ